MRRFVSKKCRDCGKKYWVGSDTRHRCGSELFLHNFSEALGFLFLVLLFIGLPLASWVWG